MVCLTFLAGGLLSNGSELVEGTALELLSWLWKKQVRVFCVVFHDSMLSCKMWWVLHVNEYWETSNAARNWCRQWTITDLSLMSPTLAWQLSRLICSSNQLHTPTSETDRALINMHSVIQIWTLFFFFFLHSKCGGFRWLGKRGLFYIKNIVFLCIHDPCMVFLLVQHSNLPRLRRQDKFVPLPSPPPSKKQQQPQMKTSFPFELWFSSGWMPSLKLHSVLGNKKIIFNTFLQSGIDKLEWLTVPACPVFFNYFFNGWAIFVGLSLQKFVFDGCVCIFYICVGIILGDLTWVVEKGFAYFNIHIYLLYMSVLEVLKYMHLFMTLIVLRWPCVVDMLLNYNQVTN